SGVHEGRRHLRDRHRECRRAVESDRGREVAPAALNASEGMRRRRTAPKEGCMTFVIRAVLAALVISIVVQPVSLLAQDWPKQPIRIVVGFGAGGGTDIAARIVAQPLSELLGQPVVVENRVGGGGTTAAEAVARAPKDGYTALMMGNAHALS